MTTLEFFFKNLPPNPSVLELGTKQWRVGYPTQHKSWFTPYTPVKEYIMTDITPGPDVDVVSDAHELTKTFGENRFDAVWASSVWEHLHSPWIASAEVLRILKPGGVFFIMTHFAFMEHGYPNDYFRFTTAALAHLFKDAKEVCTQYDFPCKIVSVPFGENPAFLNVCISGIK